MLEADAFGSLMLPMATLVVVIMGLTEILGKGIPQLRPVPQALLALILGPITSTAAYAIEPSWVPTGGAEGLRGYLAAGFIGLCATVIAGLAHDKVLNAVLPSRVAEAYQKAKRDPAEPGP